MAKKATRGNQAQFTYDFGIAIAQSTVSKITRLTGATLTLASAFYALKTTAADYVDTLRGNTLRFGGVLSTLKAMEQAQNRLIKGQSYFNVKDQLSGMNQLMAMGVKVGENFDWINKAAHATGKSFTEFSNAIAAGIGGNMQSLVDMGLLTQRATRMFDKYQANTIMRQQAILNFVKNHKGLMNAIRNDFETVQDQMTRIKGIWNDFLKSILGRPNDPNSFYGQIVSSMKMVATALARNMEQIRRYAFVIGQTLGWVIRQIGHFVVWVGRQTKKALETVWSVTDNFQEQTRSMLVWLEFWKLKVLDFFKRYGSEIKLILKLLVAYKALKAVFVISDLAIASVIRYRKALLGMFALQKKYLAMMGPGLGNKFTRWLQSLAAFMPRWLRRIWVSVGKFFERNIFGGGFAKFFKSIGPFFVKLFGFIGKGLRFILGIFRNFPAILGAALKAGRALWVALNATNPVGWIILAISLLVTLYVKSKAFRDFTNLYFKTVLEYIKLLWNSVVWLYVQIRIGLIKVWNWFKEYVWNPVADFFGKVGGWISDMWGKFMNTAVGRWINEWIVEPIKAVFNWVADLWSNIMGGLQKIYNWFKGANKTVVEATQRDAAKYGIYAPTWGGTDNGTTPIGTPDVPTTPDTPATPVGTSNPITDSRKPMDYSSTGDAQATTMSFNKGAVQIIVQKGENIDENKLARKIREVIEDMERTGRKRGGA